MLCTAACRAATRRRASSLPSLLLLLLLTAMTAAVAAAASATTTVTTTTTAATRPMTALLLETTVARGIMYDRRVGMTQSRAYGTRAAVLRGYAVLYTAHDDATAAAAVTTTATTTASAAYRHRTVYVPCDAHLTRRALAQLTQAPVRGLLIEVCDDDDAHNEQLLAAHYATSASPFAVYFLARGDDTRTLRRVLQTHNTRTSRVVVAVGTRAAAAASSSSSSSKDGKAKQHAASLPATPVASASVDAYTIVSQLVVKSREARKPPPAGGGGGSARASVPRVLLTANVDTLGVAPALRSPAGASGAVAAVELWRRLTTTAATSAHGDGDSALAATTSSYSVTMLLATTARLNYAATAAWLATQKSSDVERLRMVVCLDHELLLPPRTHGNDSAAAAADMPLYMHIPDTLTRSVEGKQLQQLAHTLAAAYGVPLQVVAAKTNYHHYDLRFEHEVFTNKQIPAATFSAHRAPPSDQPFRDVRHVSTAHDVAALLRRVDFVHAFVQALLAPNLTAAAATGAGGVDDGNSSDAATPRRAVSWPGAATYLSGLLQHSHAHTRSVFARDGAALRRYMEEMEQHLRQQGSVTRGSAATALSTLHAERLALTGVRFYAPYEQTLRVYAAKTFATELALSACAVVAVAAFAWCEFGYAGVKRILLARD